MTPSFTHTTHLVKRDDVAPGWLWLYAVTFALQVPCAMARAVVVYTALSLVLGVAGYSTGSVGTLSWLVAYGPLLASLATLVLPVGGWLFEQQCGGRTPSKRERLIYEDAFEALRAKEKQLRPPARWFVVDEPEVNAAAFGDTLMVTRGLLESGQLEPVLAHELGHLNSSDARVAAALRRLTTPPRRRLPGFAHWLALVLTGAGAMELMRVPWAAYWRAREYEADAYAAGLGQADALSAFLDEHALAGDLPLPFPWLTSRGHPPTEHRIDRLQREEEQ
jgi:Zn-dependent protease with chaperone function